MTDPHSAAPEEDPERCIGQETPDPWATVAIGTASIPAPPLFEQAAGEVRGWFESDDRPGPH